MLCLTTAMLKKIAFAQKIDLLCDSHHGIYIPQIMADRLVSSGWKGIDPEDVTTCKDPDDEWYWEAWDSILNNAYYIDEEDQRWFLYQDGDLFAVMEDLDIDEHFGN